MAKDFKVGINAPSANIGTASIGFLTGTLINNGFISGGSANFITASINGVAISTGGGGGTPTTIAANSGTVGGWAISASGLYDSAAPFAGMYSIGNNSFFAGATDNIGTAAKFLVSASGDLSVTNSTLNTANITTGNVTTASIKGGSITSSVTILGGDGAGLHFNSTTLSTTGGSANFFQFAGLYTAPLSANDTFIWAGSALASFTNAPFRLSYSGDVVARNLTLSGSATINNALSLGTKFLWSASNLIIGDTTSSVGFSAPATPSASTVALYAGASTQSSASAAPFRLTYNGNLFVTTASLAGTLTNTGLISGGSANLTSASISGSAIATQSYVTSQGYLLSSGSIATASNSASLGGIAAASYAQLASSNFTAASVGGNQIYTRSTAPYQPVAFGYTGSVSVFTSSARFYNDTGGTRSVQSVRASVGTAPVGTALAIDVRKNGILAANTIFSTGSIVIAAGLFTSGASTAFNSGSSLAVGDYLTVAITQVGSSTPGSDLTVQVNWS